ncbi:MAG: AhpC/TSA family protein [Bacteroidales bacterium]|nr:AhpC/TSA family protein [Bacteroidales bacterium]
MKKTLIAALAALIFFACGRETTFTITGTVADTEMEGKFVRLEKIEDRTFVVVDSAQIIDGTYSFTGSVETPFMATLSVGTRSLRSIVLENAKIKVTTDADWRSTVTGTRNNDLLQTFSDSERVIQEKVTEIVQAFREAQQAGDTELVASLTEKHREYSEQMHKNRLEFIKNNINNFVGHGQLSMTYRRLSLEELQEVFANATRQTLQSPKVANAVDRMHILERTQVGQPFTDLRMPDPDGNYIALSDFVGKGYVMIDFTATWCGPCRVGKPAMIATFNRFKDRGFNIVGVWFDRDHDTWINGMNALNMPDWPQMSDLRFWESEGARLYAISSIPHSVLIDPNGIIIARGLRGDDLDKKLEELLGK